MMMEIKRDGCLATFKLLAVFVLSRSATNYVEVQTYYAATWANNSLHA
jgi:hypothetical protein